ncbi:MAG: hypothetical protein Q8Q28_12685 [Pseudomonadota bacterium]|nr:hypothetical protein [Pseudomonadota bacterium]
MGLDALLSKLENREPATPETPCNLAGVAAKPALSLACTLETPETPQIDNGGSDARIRAADDAATASRWWLIHYLNREPVQVASFPPATHAEVLQGRPDAVAAEPLYQSAPHPTRACTTCTNQTGRGGCGEPVASGLSDLPGVIRYSPDQGATCPAWLATLPGDLETRIRAMAERWAYSGDDLAGARADPDGWRRIIEAIVTP